MEEAQSVNSKCYKKAGEKMNSAASVDNSVANWKNMGLSKIEIMVKAAEAMIGWPYVWGASGQDCTVDKRKYFMNRSAISVGDAELIRKRCQRLNGSSGSCSGCKYYPGGAKTRIQDCQGFMKELCKFVGITLKGGGCTSMWNDNSNWSVKGKISDMPSGQVCLVFKHIASTGKMDHVGLHIGGGNIIHCSGEVKRGKTSEKGWTHYAVPKGLEGGYEVPQMPFKPTVRKGSSGIYVIELQEDLIKLGYDLAPYGADGKFGSKTENAVKEFQKAFDLIQDGVVGPMTWETLENATAPFDGVDPVPDEKHYIIQIQHLTKTEVNELKAKYPDSIIIQE